MERYEILLVKFWEGVASEKEKLELYQLLQKDKEALRDQLWQQFYQEDEIKTFSYNAHLANLRKIHQKMAAVPQSDRPLARIGKKAILVAAASISVILLVSIWYHVMVSSTVSHNQQVASSVTAEQWHCFENRTAHVRDTVLEDGSLIQLYPLSTIQFVHTKGVSATQKLYLEGKAVFRIKHDPNRLFEVITKEIRTIDIGTVFSIDARKLNQVSISLTEGSVKVVSLPASSLAISGEILRPGQCIHIDLARKRYDIVDQASVRPVRGVNKNVKDRIYKEISLNFNKVPLSSVFKYIERRYDVQLNYRQEDMRELSFTGSFEQSDTLERCMEILCSLSNLSYKKEGRIISINKTN